MSYSDSNMSDSVVEESEGRAQAQAQARAQIRQHLDFLLSLAARNPNQEPNAARRNTIRSVDIDSLPENSGPLPATKAAIDSMPRITVTETGTECAICLEEFLVAGEAREMPCKHRFHSGCVEKWLGIHGSCPVCRFVMPVEEKATVTLSLWLAGDQMDSGSGEERDLDGLSTQDLES